MDDISIDALHLTKRFAIGRKAAVADSLGQAISTTLRSPFQRLRNIGELNTFRPSDDPDAGCFTSIDDVTFRIRRGEVVGLIGHNGAGKSTLLKILSRIVQPTEGKVVTEGRVASLLEVGTGFHPDLTGRENIFMNGTVHGMRRREIERLFDSIVDFSGIDNFLDTPVKRYSSGMSVRLAFSVAAHLDSEILLVDEVLAVGDQAFQNRCLGRLDEVATSGRTVVFVSHNMAAMRRLCQRCLTLKNGQLVDDVVAGDAIDRYLHALQPESSLAPIETTLGTVETIQFRGIDRGLLVALEPAEFFVTITATTAIESPNLYLGFLSPSGERLAGLDLVDFCQPEPIAADQRVGLGFRVTSLPLSPGRYLLEIHVKDLGDNRIAKLNRMFPIEVVAGDRFGDRKNGPWFGPIAIDAKPTVQQITRSDSNGQ